jgi:Helix-turn-helix domain
LATNKYQPVMALREHLLNGNKISLLEAMLLFGVQNPNAEITRMRKDGFLIKSQRVTMAKIVRRINEHAVCKLPKGIPYGEIKFTEYWVSR